MCYLRALMVILITAAPPLIGHGEPMEQTVPNRDLRSVSLLASDEPNVLGWTKDSYGRKGFMDFTLSMRYPLLFDVMDPLRASRGSGGNVSIVRLRSVPWRAGRNARVAYAKADKLNGEYEGPC